MEGTLRAFAAVTVCGLFLFGLYLATRAGLAAEASRWDEGTFFVVTAALVVVTAIKFGNHMFKE